MNELNNKNKELDETVLTLKEQANINLEEIKVIVEELKELIK